MAEGEQKIHRLLQVIRTGNEFYQHVQDRVNDRELNSCLDANMAERVDIQKDLESLLGDGNSQEENGRDLETQLELERADMRALRERNTGFVYMDELERLERKTQRVFHEALEEARSQRMKSALQTLEHGFGQLHGRMQSARDEASRREAPTTMPTRMMRRERQSHH